MISGVGNTSSTPDPKAAPKPAASQTDALANKETFLQLLVAQIKNQNPLEPQDGVQFISQLAQFSGLEQAMTTNKELTAIHDLLAQKANPTTDPKAIPAAT
jgi:flagellar basal-body rod modification protein FlgD